MLDPALKIESDNQLYHGHLELPLMIYIRHSDSFASMTSAFVSMFFFF